MVDDMIQQAVENMKESQIVEEAKVEEVKVEEEP